MNQLESLVAQYAMKPLLEHTHALLALIEKDGRLLAWNSALEQLAKQVSIKNTIQDFLSQESQETYLELWSSARETQQAARGNLEFNRQEENNGVQFDCTLNPLPDGRILFIAEMSVYDHSLPDKYNHLLKLVTQLKVDYDQVKKILIAKQTEIDAVVAQAKEVSHIDPLTYLPNRRQIINDLQHETLRSERYKTPLSISMMDIDHFKEINDTFGHQVGDEVLRSIAMHLREHIRLPDIVGRYGGEEFLILLPNSLMEAAAEQAERLCRQINETEINASGRTIRMTVSIGIAQYHIGAESWQKLLNRADAALYRAKNNGRNTWAAADE